MSDFDIFLIFLKDVGFKITVRILISYSYVLNLNITIALIAKINK